MKYIVIGIILIGITTAIFLSRSNAQPQQNQSDKPTQNAVSNTQDETAPVTTIAQKLDTPWAVVTLPEKTLLVTERNGQIKKITNDRKVQTITTLPEAEEIGEGGLLGMALHPKFETNNYIYFYYTYSSSGDNTLNRVERYIFKNDTLTNSKKIVDQIPGATNHNGGRIAFGPDGYLYITTGDAAQPSLAQNKNSLAGKILRVTDEGASAPGNPFDNAVYSYGHRNPQGLAWRGNELWETEHGPFANDELNRIQAGSNYGWPDIQGNQTREGMVSPVVHSGFETWAPGGLIYINDKFYFTGLRGQGLFVFDPENQQSGVGELFKGEYGRLRLLSIDGNGGIYMGTSNLDGRGSPNDTDDSILRLSITALQQ